MVNELDILESGSVRDVGCVSKLVLLDGEIKAGVGSGVIQSLLELQSIDPINDITMLINSPGGDVNELMAIIDIMNLIHNDIKTVVIGKAMSAGAIIAICGAKGKRFMTANSVMMLHSVSAGTFGHVKDIHIEVEEIKRLNDAMINLIHTKSKLSIKEVKALIDRDRYILPKEAIRLGLIDGICTSLK